MNGNTEIGGTLVNKMTPGEEEGSEIHRRARALGLGPRERLAHAIKTLFPDYHISAGTIYNIYRRGCVDEFQRDKVIQTLEHYEKMSRNEAPRPTSEPAPPRLRPSSIPLTDRQRRLEQELLAIVRVHMMRPDMQPFGERFFRILESLATMPISQRRFAQHVLEAIRSGEFTPTQFYRE